MGQVLLAPLDFIHRQQYLHARQTLSRLLELGVVPVVNENDATSDDEIRFGDNDRLAALVAHLVAADLLVLLTDTAGLLTADPRTTAEASLIEEVVEVDHELEVMAGGAGSAVGSGGMASKLAAAKIAAWSGVRDRHRRRRPGRGARRRPSTVEPGVGTVFRPRPGACRPGSCGSRSPWPRRGHSSSTRGPAGRWSRARRRCCPAGVVSVSGRFDADDAVEIAGPDGVVFAKGLARHARRAWWRRGRAAARASCPTVPPPRWSTATISSCWPDRGRAADPRWAGAARRPGCGGGVPWSMARDRHRRSRPARQGGGPGPGRGRRRCQGRRAARGRRPARRATAPSSCEHNAADLERARAGGATDTELDRLRLTDGADGGHGRRACARWPAWPTPSARWSRGGCAPTACASSGSGCRSGWSAIIYENRPNVTSDAAGLCLKAGNATMLRGSSTRAALQRRHRGAACARRSPRSGLPEDAVVLVGGHQPEAAVAFMQLDGVDRLPRPPGGPSLIASVREHATVPYVIDGDGNCHVYVDAAADLDMALSIVVNAKTQRPGVCNAAESLVVHAAVAAQFLPRAARGARPGSSCVGDAARRAAPARHGAATEDDFAARVPGPRAVGGGRGRSRRRHRPHRPLRLGALRGHRHHATWTPPSGSAARSTPPPSW